ncbi:restriction endonuclease subunit S [Psychrobacter glaciei]|uniref:restriction endonuclease subunit S n=1 Tax=Psychrobacter glaciei TaxID=619771 RepID=UPI003F48C5A0
MASDWEVVKLKNAAQFFSGGTPPKSKPEYWGGDIPWISAKSMKGSRYHDSDLKLTEAGLKKGSRLAPKNSILLLVRGSMLHQKIPVGIATKDVAFNQDVKAIVPNEKFLPLYFYYCFAGREHELLAKVENTGIGAGKLDTDVLNKVEFYCPPIQEQKVIANFLGSLDDKIELNRQMNETLEAMAQALFESWFVDFDPVIDNALAAGNAIPDEFSERAEQRKAIEKKDNSDIQNLFPDEFEFTEEMGWIPRGWAVGKYSDLAELNPLSWSKKSMPEEISYVDLGNTNNGKIDLVVSYSSSEAPSRAKRVLSTDDTIIGTVRPGNRSFAFIHNEGLTGSTGFAVMKPIESINRTYIYLGLTQSIVIDYFAHIADGGAYPAINPSVVADLECIIPPSEVLEKFDDLAYCFLKKIGENSNHNETLAKIRDTLLPKLMSGELRISDAAMLVDEVL